jgi:hypothetical protein
MLARTQGKASNYRDDPNSETDENGWTASIVHGKGIREAGVSRPCAWDVTHRSHLARTAAIRCSRESQDRLGDMRCRELILFPMTCH